MCTSSIYRKNGRETHPNNSINSYLCVLGTLKKEKEGQGGWCVVNEERRWYEMSQRKAEGQLGKARMITILSALGRH